MAAPSAPIEPQSALPALASLLAPGPGFTPPMGRGGSGGQRGWGKGQRGWEEGQRPVGTGGLSGGDAEQQQGLAWEQQGEHSSVEEEATGCSSTNPWDLEEQTEL